MQEKLEKKYPDCISHKKNGERRKGGSKVIVTKYYIHKKVTEKMGCSFRAD